jgi:hypothetical protein
VQLGYLLVPQTEEESESDINVFNTSPRTDGLDGYRKKKNKSEIVQFDRFLQTNSQTYFSSDCGCSIDENAADVEHTMVQRRIGF